MMDNMRDVVIFWIVAGIVATLLAILTAITLGGR